MNAAEVSPQRSTGKDRLPPKVSPCKTRAMTVTNTLAVHSKLRIEDGRSRTRTGFSTAL